MDKICFRKAVSIVVMFSLILSVSGCATYRMHPEFKERHKYIKIVSTMPPDVEIYQVTFKGDKKLLHELMSKLSKASQDEIEQIFRSKNYVVRKLKLNEKRLSVDSALKNACYNVKQLFNKVIEDIRRRKKKEFTYSLGADINRFADMANSDILVFIKESGFKKTAGEIAKDVIKSVLIGIATFGTLYVRYWMYATVIQIAIVDGNDGAILWYNTNEGSPEIDAANVKHIRGTIRNLLKPFPDSAFEKTFIDDSYESKVKKVDMTSVSTQPPDVQRPIIQQPVTQKRPLRQGLTAEERLERLEEAYKKGLITEPQYKAEREIILNTISIEE